MTCVALDLYAVAESLAAQSSANQNDEALRRSALNRLYYSVFHVSKEFHSSLTTPGTVGNSKGSHEQLISVLDNPTIPKSPEYWKSKAISKILRVPLAARVVADYELSNHIDHEELVRVESACKQIVDKVYPQHSAPSALASSV